MRTPRVIARAALFASFSLILHTACGDDDGPPSTTGFTGPGGPTSTSTSTGGGEGGAGTGGAGTGGTTTTVGGGGSGPEGEDCYDGSDGDGNGEVDCIDNDPACATLCDDPCSAPKVLADGTSYNAHNEGFAVIDGASCVASIGGGPTNVFAVTAATTGLLEVDVSAQVATDDFTVSIRSTCGDAGSELVCAEKVHGDMPPGFERAKVAVTQGETVYVLVQGYAAIDTGAYLIDVESYLPTCGDGKIDPPETCDDGQATPASGDGCSATCQFESSEGASNDLPPGDVYTFPYFGEINPHTDKDTVSVVVPGPNYSLVAETFDLGNGACSAGELDSFISVSDAAFTQVASDDDSGDTYCARARAFGLSAGTYYVRVSASAKSPATHTFIYFLNIDMDQCGNGTIGGAEVCDDGNTTNGDGCSSVCQNE